MKTAVISGGAGGLGRALSSQLQAEGWRVILLDLDVSALDQTKTQIPLACDLTDQTQLAAAMDQVLAISPLIDLVVYNAGITHIGAFGDTTDATHRKVFDINYFAAVAMARALQGAVRQANGTHLAISSVAGFAPLYHRTAYAGSKHALEGFFKSLRSEETPHGVSTLIAAPSFVATNIGNDQRQEDGTARPGSATDGVDYMTPHDAARDILTGLHRARPMNPIGRVARLSWWINSLSPRVYQRLMERSIRDDQH